MPIELLDSTGPADDGFDLDVKEVGAVAPVSLAQPPTSYPATCSISFGCCC